MQKNIKDIFDAIQYFLENYPSLFLLMILE